MLRLARVAASRGLPVVGGRAVSSGALEPQPRLFGTVFKAGAVLFGGLVIGAFLAQRGAEFLDKDLGIYHFEPEDDDEDDPDDKKVEEAVPMIFGLKEPEDLAELSEHMRLQWYHDVQQLQVTLMTNAKEKAQSGFERELLTRTLITLEHNVRILQPELERHAKLLEAKHAAEKEKAEKEG